MSETLTLTAPAELILPNGLAAETAEALRLKFDPFQKKAETWMDQARAIKVKDVSDTDGMNLARTSRLAAVKIRGAIEKTRKEAKDESLKYGKAVDTVAKQLTESMLAIEAKLKEKEEYAERMEAQRLAALRVSRREQVQKFIEVPDYLNLEVLTDEQFAEMLAKAERQAAFEKAEIARIDREDEEARIKAEEDAKEALRIQAERIAAEKAERERQAAELAKLKEEMEAQEAQAKTEREEAARKFRAAEAKARAEREAADEAARIEREKLLAERAAADKKAAEEYAAAQAKARAAEAAVRKEREAREKLEREAAARKAEEQARIAKEKEDAEEARRKAEAAPDAVRIRAFAETVHLLDLPKHAATPAGEKVMEDVRARTAGFVNWIKSQAATLQ